MTNAIFGVCHGTIFARLIFFTMRNSGFEFSMVKKRGTGYEEVAKRVTKNVELGGDGFFYHEISVLDEFHGKKQGHRNQRWPYVVYSSISPASFASFLIFFLEIFFPQKSIKSLVSPLNTSHG